MTIHAPISITLERKTKPPIKYHLNLNNYPNWHYFTYNKLKNAFCEALRDDLSGLKLKPPVSLHFTLFKPANRKTDRSNILSVIDKFFCDALVHYECLPDDCDDYIKSCHYYSGGIDRKNPRCEIRLLDNQE